MDGLLWHLSLSDLSGELMGVMAENGLGALAGVDFLLAEDLRMGTFLRVVILEGVEVNDLIMGGGAILYCLTVGENSAEKEELDFLAAC